jgi:FixJ family two-component response regulator
MNPQPATDHSSSHRAVADGAAGMAHGDHAVLVLDDDASILSGLERLLTAHGYRVRLHAEPDQFFRAGVPGCPACLLLDNQLGNGRTGVEVHAEMQRRGWDIPTVFVTAHWDVQTVVRVMRAGADDFIAKPYDPAELMAAVARALQRARTNQRTGLLATETRAKAACLTPREREIVRLVVTGLLNKEIADQLALALVTVKIHRGRAMRKLGAGNPADLARLAALAGITC